MNHLWYDPLSATSQGVATSGVLLCNARTTARTTETGSMVRTEGAVRNSPVMRVRIKCGDERRYLNAGAAEFSADGPSEFENSVFSGAVPCAVYPVLFTVCPGLLVPQLGF